MARRSHTNPGDKPVDEPVESDKPFHGCPVKWHDSLNGTTNWYQPPSTIPKFYVNSYGEAYRNSLWPDGIDWKVMMEDEVDRPTFRGCRAKVDYPAIGSTNWYRNNTGEKPLYHVSNGYVYINTQWPNETEWHLEGDVPDGLTLLAEKSQKGATIITGTISTVVKGDGAGAVSFELGVPRR
jgi:hypothetical protein